MRLGEESDRSTGANMRKWITAIVFITVFLWALQVSASPIGDRPRIWPEFQYRDGSTDSPFRGVLDDVNDEISAMDLLFGEVEHAPKVEKDAKFSSEEGRTKIPVNTFVFAYGAYLHQWNIPRHQVARETIVFQEKPFDYRGPPPEPAPPPVIPKDEGDKYRYPDELMEPVHQHPTGLADTFELEYAVQLEEDAVRFKYPFAPKDLPEPEQRVFMYGEVSPGTGESGAGYGPAQQQGGYQYPAGGGAGRGYGVEREAQTRKKEVKGGIDTFKQKGTSGTAKDRPYAMILLGAGMSAVAALFRMFRLSLFIFVGWMVFYGQDLWYIIVELQ